MAKLTILCGLIGSGKTTYARQNFGNVSDLDYMPDGFTKTHQIKHTLNLLLSGKDVCHITCFPTPEEMASFANIETEFLVLNTTSNQCKTNIMIRNRQRDMQNIGSVLQANIDYAKKIERTNIPFRRLTVFKGLE